MSCALLLFALAGCGGDLPELFVEREGSVIAFHEPGRACITCHPDHVEEWQMSNHAYAMHDPVFVAMVKVGQRQSEGRLGQFCVQCHSPIGMAQGQTTVELDESTGVHEQNLELDPVAMTGVSCDVCHSVTDVIEPRNARMVYTPDGTYRATIEDPEPTNAHQSAYSELHESSDLCGSCHNVTNPAGALIEETYDEWASSDFADEGGQTCQDCHMPEYTGRATPDAAEERTLHRHNFVGVDVSLLPPDEFPGYDELRYRTAELLVGSVEVHALFSTLAHSLTVDIENKAGHRLPSGATAERQMWLEIVVENEDREILWATGTLDGRGDIRDDNPKHTLRPGSDPYLVKYGQRMLGDPDSSGVRPEVTFPWQAKDVDNHLIEPGGTDTHVFDLSELPPGDHRITVRLLFRTFPPYFLRELETEAELDPEVKKRVPTVVMYSEELEVPFTTDPVPPDDPECDSDTVVDCDGVCWPEEWLGDGLCDDGTGEPWADANFDCASLDYDGGDCPVDPGCPDDERSDCVGECWPEEWLGDGTCDDGTSEYWGDPDFACDDFDWDGGDCEPPIDWDPDDDPVDGPCRDQWSEDCAGECYPDSWVGDGYCDDGSEQVWGSADFDCSDFGDDGGDCD